MICRRFAAACSVVALIFLIQPVNADFVLTDVGVPVVEDYDNYRGRGFTPSPSTGQLDSNTYRAVGFSDGDGVFGGTYTTGDFARGDSPGGVTEGGAYAFEVNGGDFALGVQPTDVDFNPGALTIRVSNQTGTSLSGFRIEGDGLFFNDQDRSTRWTFALSLNDSTYFTGFSLDSPEEKDPVPAWDATPLGRTFIFPFGPISNGSQFYLRITGADLAGSGDRDEFALNNFSITGIPEPSAAVALTLLLGPLAAVGSRRRRK